MHDSERIIELLQGIHNRQHTILENQNLLHMQNENILTRLESIMAQLSDILADVTSETTVISSLSTLISGLQSQLAAALSSTTIPPAVQSQIDQIFTAAEANKAALAAALVAGTPAAPTAPVVPTGNGTA